MDRAVGDIGRFPGKRRCARQMHNIAEIQQIGLDHGVGRIEKMDAVGFKRIAIEIRRQRGTRSTPDTLLVFLHSKRTFGAFDADTNLLSSGRAQAERYRAIGMNLGRLQGGWPLREYAEGGD